MLSIFDFVGRFHPLLVHLPIGVLLLACLFQWLILLPRWGYLKNVIPFMFLLGLLAAIFSCISGYFLSLSGDYEGDTTNQHQWFGIATAVAALLMCVIYRLNPGEWTSRIGGVIVVVLLSITGHLGGTLTHGEGYLTEGLSAGDKEQPIWKPMQDIQQATVYTDLVQPILTAKCNTCHGSSKQKGKLRLDSPEFITKGGKSGDLIVAGNPEKSLMMERLLLPLNHEDHMPPKEKTQLSPQELEVIRWWIQQGGDYHKKVDDLKQDEKTKSLLNSIQAGIVPTKETRESDWPEAKVSPANTHVIEQLKDAGVTIIPISANSNYLQAGFFALLKPADSILHLLPEIKEQLVSLKLDGLTISDDNMKHIGALHQLRRLQLSNVPVTDAGLAAINNLQELRTLNLSATQVTAEGLQVLKSLQKLRNVYVYKSNVNSSQYNDLKKLLPQVEIDTGGYIVPTYESDTTLLKF